MRSVDLFSGIGGISLALAPYCRTVAYCDISSDCQRVLKARMHDERLDAAPVFGDVRSICAESLADAGVQASEVDIVTAGFPCQDLSVAGKQMGLLGDTRSSLWREALRVADLCGRNGAEFIFLENVPHILSMREKGFGAIHPELQERGYHIRWTVVSCADVGACHQRARWWCLCWKPPDSTYMRPALAADVRDTVPKCVHDLLRRSDRKGEQACTAWPPQLPPFRVYHGVSTGLDRDNRLRCGMVGNAVCPLVARIAYETLLGLQYIHDPQAYHVRGEKKKKVSTGSEADRMQEQLPFGWVVLPHESSGFVFYSPTGKKYRTLRSAQAKIKREGSLEKKNGDSKSVDGVPRHEGVEADSGEGG